MALAPLLAVEKISKSFTGVKAVDDLSFQVRRGEIFGFLGPNGAGKTTTLRSILGILAPDEGEVLFEGTRGLDRGQVGYLPEERGLLDDATLRDLLVYLGTLRGMGRRDAARAALVWLERLGLKEQATRKLQTLSKGNQQKVQFAGAVLHDPALIVLDEPFSGLDPLNQDLFSALIRGLRDAGAGVLLSAHQLNLAEKLCDRFLLLSRGRIALTGTLQEIRRATCSGTGEILEVEVHPRNGVAALARRLTDDVVRVLPRGENEVVIEVTLARDEDLGPLLSAIAEEASIQHVNTRAISLHEIYVRAVGDA